MDMDNPKCGPGDAEQRKRADELALSLNAHVQHRQKLAVVMEREFGQTCGGGAEESPEEAAIRLLRDLRLQASRWPEVVSEAVHSLIRVREFLGLQLDHAWGNISETEFETRAEEYFAEQESGDPNELQEKIRLLASVMNAPLDGEMASAIFKCSIVDTHRAMAALEEERKLLPRNG